VKGLAFIVGFMPEMMNGEGEGFGRGRELSL